MSFFSEGITRNKLIIMYSLSKLGAAPTREQMTTFFGEYELIPFFDLQSAVYELEEDAFIAAVPRPYGQAYCLTGKGKESLDMFSERLPGSLREEIERCSGEFSAGLRRETQYGCSYERAGQNAYRVAMRAMELNGELLRIELLLPDEASAKRACSVWPNEAEKIYTTLLEHLIR